LEKEAKTFFRLAGGWISGEQEFFGSFFQKRTACLACVAQLARWFPTKLGTDACLSGKTKQAGNNPACWSLQSAAIRT
jgi:hypothetical protein